MTLTIELLALILIILIGSRVFSRFFTLALKLWVTLFCGVLMLNGLASMGVSVIDIFELLDPVVPLDGLNLLLKLIRPSKLLM